MFEQIPDDGEKEDLLVFLKYRMHLVIIHCMRGTPKMKLSSQERAFELQASTPR